MRQSLIAAGMFLLTGGMVGCGTSSTQEKEDLIVVDVSKDYPKKELILQDLFDVEYIPLETTDEFVTLGWLQAIGVGDVGEKVIDDRIQLSNDGIVVVGVTIDSRTKEIIAQTDCQTRGFVYLKDSDYVIKEIINICEGVVSKLKDDPQMDVQDIRNEMKELSMRYIMKETGKKPVFIGVVVEI